MASNVAAPGLQPTASYESKPPEWLVKATRDGDLGYYGFHPPRPGQEEEILSESNIKHGYSEPYLFGAELWPGTDAFMGVFKQESKNGLESLQDLMDKVIARRSQLYAVVEDQPLKLPSRMSATGDKKVQYYEKLSNPDVPLHELTRVQHQLRTADSLEAIYAQKVPADRTFWYIRALGAIEVVGKYKPGAAGNHSGVIPEWTAALTAFLKRQLSEIAMPAVSRTGTNIKQVFKKAKLSDPEGREAWIDKFSWSLELLRRLFDADLIDQPSFLTWVVTSMGHTEAMGPHQFIFLIRMVDEYFDSVASNRAFATPIIEACLSRFAEIDVSPVKQYATCILDEVSSLILRFFRTNEDLFANRGIVINHYNHLQDLLQMAIQQLDSDIQPRIKEDTIARFNYLMERLRSIFSIELPSDESSQEVKSRLEDIAKLNTIDMDTDLTSFSFLPSPSLFTNSDSRPFSQKLFTLLSWAVTLGQAGDPLIRPYIATTLIFVWKSQATRALPNASQFLQRQLLSWLEEKGFFRPSAHQSAPVPPLKALFWRKGESADGELEAAALLFGDLVHRRLFSFTDYLTRMTSFGQGAISSPAKSDTSMDNECPTPPAPIHQDHLELLRHMPLWDKMSEQLLNQRKIVLYGIRARKTIEDAKEKEIRAEIRRVVPLFFNGPPPEEPFSRSLLTTTLSASKFSQARVVNHWLFDLVKDYISRTSASSALAQRPVLPLPVYHVLSQIFSWTGCHIALFELNNLMLYHAMDDELLVSTVRSILRHLTTWISMSRVDRIVDVLLETNARLKEQTRKNSKPIISLLQELDRCCILSSNTKGRIQNELNEARKVLLSEHSSSSPAPPILPFILAAIQENSLEQPTDVATTMWYKNHAHANWGSASWDAVVAAVGSRAWDPSVPDQAMAERFTSLVRCIDAHLPDGIQDVIRIWFETTGAERMSEALDDEWHIIEHMALSLTCAGIISPQTALDGLVYPMWNRCFQPQKMADDSSPFLRTLPLASAILLCDSPRCSGDGDFVLQLEICRTRCSRPSNFPSILRATYALAALEQSPSKDPAVGEQIAAIRRRLIQDSYLRHTVLSRTQLQEEVFEKIIAEYPELKAALIPNLKESLQDMSVALQTGEEPMFASQWARVMTTVDFWSFPVAKLSLRLYLEQLRQKALRDQVASGGIQPLDDSYLESLASVLSEGQLSSSGISLMTELVRGAEPALPEKIVRHGLEQLSSCFSSTEPDDPVQFLAFAKEILRLIVTFRRIETTPAPLIWPADLQDEFLRKWADKVSALQQSIQENKKRLRGQDIQEIADTICVMMRVLHLFSELFGPDLGLKVVPLISTIIQLAVMFGGGVTYDDMTFSILMDTVCILMDDCSKETRIHVQNALTQVANIALPSHLPAPSRYRIESILPFNPQDKTVSNLGQARRVNGDLEYISTVRNQSWGWMESVDPQEPPSVLSTRVRSSAAMRLELFETTSKGESILSDKRISDTSKQAGDLWLFRDGMASEGLLARAWRESRTAAAWDVKSMDESITSERISSSRGFSPAASRSSAHMSTSSRRGSPSQNLRGHGIPTVETLDAEPLVDSKPARTLKRKERVEEEDADGDVVMLEDHRVGSKTTQVKRPKNKVKVKR